MGTVQKYISVMWLNLFKMALVGVALFLNGCSKPVEISSGKPVVFVSILPQAGLVRELAGDFVQVRVLVDEGQSPHSYDPTARQIASLADAQVLFTIGVPFERSLIKKIRALCPDLRIEDSCKRIVRREMSHTGHDEHCAHEQGETDPHVWLAPANAIVIAENIAKTLEELDPAHEAIYAQNLIMLTDELKALDSDIATTLVPLHGQRFYVFHPSFGYFGEAYGLQQVPLEIEGKAPTPRQMVALIEQAKADGVQIIFVQKQFPADSAAAIAEAIGGSVIQLDPLAENYIQNMEQIASSIKEALMHE